MCVVLLPHSGLVAGLGYLVEDVMVSNCWTDSDVEAFVKALKFVELSAINMFAATNLAICVNLALIISVSIPSPQERESARFTLERSLLLMTTNRLLRRSS